MSSGGNGQSFRAYLVQRSVSGTPTGEFVKLALSDPMLPDADTWLEIKSYLLKADASDAALKAGYVVWVAYRAWLRHLNSFVRKAPSAATPKEHIVHFGVMAK